MKRVLYFIAALLTISLSWQCQYLNIDMPSPHPFVFGDTLQLEYGQTINLLPENIEIRFDSIVSESRCPATVECIWAGLAEVKLQFAQGSATQTGLLNTLNDPEFIIVFGKTVRLIDVLPYPQVPEVIIPQEDYKIRIVVE